MLSVTERAKQELKRLLRSSVDWPGARLRLIDRGNGKLGLGIDIEMPDDKIIEYEGAAILIIESELASSLKEITLDIDNTPLGPELVISEETVEETSVNGAEESKPLPSSSEGSELVTSDRSH